MNQQYRYKAIPRTRVPVPRGLALAVAVALVFPGAAAIAQNTSNPIPGVDIIVKKNPGTSSVTLPMDASGRFSLRLTEPGRYTLSTVCRLPTGCASHAITATYSGDSNFSRVPGADGAMTYNFTVGVQPVVLSGDLQRSGGVRVVVGDVNGDGIAKEKTLLDGNASVGAAFKIADNESPRPTDRALALPGNKPATPDIENKCAGCEEASSALGQVSTTRGTAPRPDGGDVKPGVAQASDPLTDGLLIIRYAAVPGSNAGNADPSIFDRWGNRAGTLPNDGTAVLPGRTVANVSIRIDSGSSKASVKTDKSGAFQFAGLRPGPHQLSIDGQSARSVVVGTDGTIRGDLKRGSDGTLYVTSFSFGAEGTGPGAGRNPNAGFGAVNTLGFGAGLGSAGIVIPGASVIPGGPASSGSAMGGAR